MSSWLDKYFKMDEASRKVTTSIGMSSSRMIEVKQSLQSAAKTTVKWGVGVEQLGQGQLAYTEALGRSVVLSEQAMINMTETSKATGMAYDEMAGLAGEMEAFGLGANDSVNMIWEISQTATKMGVSQSKVVKKFQANLGLLNKLDFKGGVKGMAKMAAFSEKFKLSMESVAAVSDQVFRPEGAVEAAAQLQVLGGSLSQLGDPMQLMYQARYAPEDLAKSITKAATASAVFNEKTGEFEVNAMELDRMREAAKALGMDYTELVKTAKQSSKIKFFEKGLVGKGMSKEEMDTLTGLATMENGKAMINIDGDDKLLSSLNGSDLKKVIAVDAKRQEAADNAMSVREKINVMQNQLLQALMPTIDKMVNWLDGGGFDTLRDTVTYLAEIISDWGKYIVGFVAVGAGLSKAMIIWAAAAKIYNAIKVGGGAIIDRGKSLFGGGGGNPASSAQQKATPQMNHKSRGNKSRGSSGSSSGSSQGKLMKSLSKVDPKQILALGAAMLMVGGAIWIVSDAMVKMKEAGVGFQEVIGVMGASIAIMIPLVAALAVVGTVGALPILALGAAFLMIGGAVWLASQGMAVLVESFTGLFSVLNMDMLAPMMLMGPALGMITLGMLGLSYGVLALGAAVLSPMGWAAIAGLTGLAALSTVDFSGVATSFERIGQAISSFDTEKIDGLSNAAMWLSMASLGGDIDVNLSDLTVKGEIGISGGGATADAGWVENPIFINKLKDVIFEALEKESKGGKR
jgi:flagellar hook-basal body complex protein FliE